MSEEFGPLNFAGGGKQEVFLGKDFSSNERHSEDTSKRIDAEIRRIVMAQHERAVSILRAHRPELEAVAQALLEYETIDGEDITVLLKGERLSRPVPATAKKKIELSVEGTDGQKRPTMISATPEPA